MFGRDRFAQAREASNAWALFYSSLLILAAVIGFLIAATSLSGVSRSLLYSLSSTVLPIGLISFMYEFRLRQRVQAELLRLVGIEKSLTSHHLHSATEASRFDWSTVLNDASNFRILLSEPGSWVHGNWNSIIEGGRERPIHLEFFFPDPNSEWFTYVAKFYNVSEIYLAEDIERATRIAEDQWNIANDAGDLNPGSILQVRHVNAFPTCSVVRADNTVVVTLFSSTSRPSTDSGFALTFKGSGSDYPIDRYDKELDQLSADTPLQYEKEIGTKRNEP